MEFEAEAILDQLLHHGFHLVDTGQAGDIGLGQYVELFRVDPRGRADDLLRMHVIGEFDQFGKIGVQRMELAASVHVDSKTRAGGIGRV